MIIIIRRIGNQGKNQDYSIVGNGQYSEKNLVDKRNFAVIQNPVKDHHLMLVR